jgi:hypothetical protein
VLCLDLKLVCGGTQSPGYRQAKHKLKQKFASKLVSELVGLKFKPQPHILLHGILTSLYYQRPEDPCGQALTGRQEEEC